MEKQISFSDFLKEGALKEEHTAEVVEQLKSKPLRLEADTPATKEELKSFWKKLRHFYRTGQKQERIIGKYFPALPAPYLKGEDWVIDYPFFLPDAGNGITLKQLLENTINATFEENRVKIIRSNTPRILGLFQKHMKEASQAYDFANLKEEVFSEFLKLEVHGPTGERFTNNVNLLKTNLPNSGELINFCAFTPLFMLRHQLNNLKHQKIKALEKVNSLIDDLKELLLVDAQKKGASGTAANENIEFAADIISMEKVSELVPDDGVEKMSDQRRERINTIISTLEQGAEWLMQNHYQIIASERVAELLSITKVFDKENIEIAAPAEVCQKSHQVFDETIAAFTPFVAARRMAKLEIDGAFNEEVHTEFFEHFNWHRFNGEEIDLAPTILLFSVTNVLLNENLSNFSKLLSANKPIKVFAFTQEVVKEPNPFISWEDASYSYKQDIVSFSISHRSPHTYQGALDQPENLSIGILNALKGLNPSVVNTLIPSKISNRNFYIQITSAVEGRYSPVIQYDVNQGKWGSRFSINQNPQPEKDWPEYPLTYQDISSEMVSTTMPFTYADYKALNVDKVAELMIVPESYVTDALVHIADFLKLSPEEITGKVPFIWLVDEQNVLVRAAMPYMWAISCQERLDHWNFIQELGGVNSHHVAEALQQANQVWEKAKQDEISALKANFEKTLQKTKDEAVGEAMKSLSNVLLNLEGIKGTAATITKATANKSEEGKPVEAEKPNKKEVSKPKAKETPKEVTLDSFNCTSCNDCIDKLPAVFAYNDDKQAYVKDPNKGTFAEIVEAAEGCPARCIHPGAPKNPNEPDLEEWIKRASKYN